MKPRQMNLLQLPRSQREGVNIHATQRITLKKLYTSDVMGRIISLPESARRGGLVLLSEKTQTISKWSSSGRSACEPHRESGQTAGHWTVYFVSKNNSENSRNCNCGWIIDGCYFTQSSSRGTVVAPMEKLPEISNNITLRNITSVWGKLMRHYPGNRCCVVASMGL